MMRVDALPGANRHPVAARLESVPQRGHPVLGASRCDLFRVAPAVAKAAWVRALRWPIAISGLKPIALSDIEISLIQAHAQAGYDILKGIEFPWAIADMVLQHHERLDGSGYPQGLAGDDILLEARIICVGDVVETMSSHRPYRPSMGVDKALAEISSNKGVLYDPRVVDACLTLFNEKKFAFC